MQTIEKNGWIFGIRDDGGAVLTECHTGTPIIALPSAVDGHPLVDVEYDAFYPIGGVEAFRVENDHPAFSVQNGTLFSRSRDRLIRYPDRRDGDEYTVPAGVRAIAYGAFAGAEHLKRAVLPEGILTVEGRAFCDCTELAEVVLPRSLQRFDHEVFSGCPRLKDVTVPENHDFLYREGCFLVDDREHVLLTCLAGCCPRQVEAPEGIRTVDEYAFECCDQLQKIRFHHGLRNLGRYAFYHCASLREVELQDGLRSIGGRAFSGCAQLRSLYVPDSVTSIEYKAFNNCDKLVLLVNKGSYADRYCRQFGFPCRHRMQWPWQR